MGRVCEVRHETKAIVNRNYFLDVIRRRVIINTRDGFAVSIQE